MLRLLGVPVTLRVGVVGLPTGSAGYGGQLARPTPSGAQAAFAAPVDATALQALASIVAGGR